MRTPHSQRNVARQAARDLASLVECHCGAYDRKCRHIGRAVRRDWVSTEFSDQLDAACEDLIDAFSVILRTPRGEVELEITDRGPYPDHSTVTVKNSELDYFRYKP